MRVVCWGTYDTGKPRNRILLRGMRENGFELYECHKHVWEGVEDKTQVQTLFSKVKFLMRWLFSYPGLIVRYLRLPKHDMVFVGYLGQLDVLILWPFAKLRGIPVCWDVFISLYDTIVRDRKLISKNNPLAWLIYCFEWLACRCCDIALMDTETHVDFLRQLYGLEKSKTGSVPVGAEPERFPLVDGENIQFPGARQNEATTILFYGQFIPLHGIETIIDAAYQLKGKPVKWIIIGQGQEKEKIRKLLEKRPLERLQWIEWVDYSELIQWIASADICLGIFGTSDKAGRVIPNKVYQILCSGKPLVTRDSSAIRELVPHDIPGVYLVKPGDAQELAKMISALVDKKENIIDQDALEDIRQAITPDAIGMKFKNLLSDLGYI